MSWMLRLEAQHFNNFSLQSLRLMITTVRFFTPSVTLCCIGYNVEMTENESYDNVLIDASDFILNDGQRECEGREGDDLVIELLQISNTFV
jgi:hypothetical protein